MSVSSRILYVDDNKDSCEMLSAMLPLYSDWKYSVTAVETADRAISLMEKQAFDIYILDYVLPDISGVELCERIRKTDAETPILFFTGKAQEADRKKAINAGASEYLVKPNDLIKLTETVKQLLNEK
jgi:CheY-like chemotaxis protein